MSGCKNRVDACKDAGTKITQVACGSGYIVMGEMRVPITGMFDAEGEPTTDIDEICAVEFGDAEFGTATVRVVPNPDPYEYDN